VSSSYTGISDEKGRYGMLGLRGGIWTVTASAPGYAPIRGATRVQSVGANSPIDFRLTRVPAPPPGPLAGIDTTAMQAELTAAADLMARAQYGEAIAAYSSIRDRFPALTSVHLELAHAYRLMQEFDKAIANLDAVEPDDPRHALAQVERGLVHLDRGELELAERVLMEVVSATGASSGACLALGLVKLQAHQPQDARKWLEQTISLDPASDEAARAREELHRLNP
jgi:tetratricopeptide (TPR) repeat protein